MTASASARLADEEVDADLFAGGGGASLGCEMALGTSPYVAINHNEAALRTHAANHRNTIHLCESVFKVDPRKAIGHRRLRWLHASPDCTDFSRAKGGKPRDQGIRGLAWVVLDWARILWPRLITLENVAEFLGWGPLDDDGKRIPERKGETFRQFVAALELLGYRVEWRVLVAADLDTPTTRKRLFLIARRDARPIVWPAPTNGPGLAPWRTAGEDCIDWSIPCRSIFGRKKDLAEATQRRIAEGVRRYVIEAAHPYLVGNAAPFLVNTRNGERAGQAPRVRSVERPLPTLTAQGSQGAVCVAFLAKHNGSGESWNAAIGQGLDEPMHTITGRDTKALVTASLDHGNRAAEVAAFLIKFYGQGGQWQGLDEPMHTIVSKARFGLVGVMIEGRPRIITDIGMRMLVPREMARGQGFPDSYVFLGTKTQQIAQIGNSAPPKVIAAIARANLPEHAVRMAA